MYVCIRYIHTSCYIYIHDFMRYSYNLHTIRYLTISIHSYIYDYTGLQREVSWRVVVFQYWTPYHPRNIGMGHARKLGFPMRQIYTWQKYTDWNWLEMNVNDCECNDPWWCPLPMTVVWCTFLSFRCYLWYYRAVARYGPSRIWAEPAGEIWKAMVGAKPHEIWWVSGKIQPIPWFLRCKHGLNSNIFSGLRMWPRGPVLTLRGSCGFEEPWQGIS